MRNPLAPLLLASLMTLPAVAQPTKPQPDASVLTLWQQESYLLNQRVSLGSLDVWDAAGSKWRPLRGETPLGRARVLVLHVWADWCQPCVQELPVLRELALRLAADYNGDVTVAFLSETHLSEQMSAFLRANPEALKDLTLYHDSNGRLADNLAQALPQSAVTLPTTLILDRDLVVRQALVGPQLQRRGELVNGIARLLHTQRLVQKGSPDARPR